MGTNICDFLNTVIKITPISWENTVEAVVEQCSKNKVSWECAG